MPWAFCVGVVRLFRFCVIDHTSLGGSNGPHVPVEVKSELHMACFYVLVLHATPCNISLHGIAGYTSASLLAC